MAKKKRTYRQRIQNQHIHEVITRNDDFTDRKSDVPRLLKDHHPLAVLTQESKFTNYRKEIGKHWGVAQFLDTNAKQGVAVVYDAALFRPTTDQHHHVLSRGRGLLPRGITWIRGRLQGEPVILASMHRPPQRNSGDWSEFDREFKKWLRGRDCAVIVGCDTNVPGRPQRKKRELKQLARKYNMRVRGVGLDAVFITGDLRFAGPIAKAYARMRSDHKPVGALIKWNRATRKRASQNPHKTRIVNRAKERNRK